MKEYTICEPVQLSTTGGEPVPDPRGGTMAMTTRKLALQCIGHEEFTAGIEDTIEANELRASAWSKIRKWSEEAGSKEYLEDEPAKRLAKVARKVNIPGVGHLLLAFQKALANPVDVEAAPVKETP